MGKNIKGLLAAIAGMALTLGAGLTVGLNKEVIGTEAATTPYSAVITISDEVPSTTETDSLSHSWSYSYSGEAAVKINNGFYRIGSNNGTASGTASFTIASTSLGSNLNLTSAVFNAKAKNNSVGTVSAKIGNNTPVTNTVTNSASDRTIDLSSYTNVTSGNIVLSFTCSSGYIDVSSITLNYSVVTEDLVAASVTGNSSINAGTQWSGSVTEDIGGATVNGVTFAFETSNGAHLSASDTSAGTFTADVAGTVTVSATKSGYSIADKVVTVNPVDPYINLTLTSGNTAFTGQTVTITAAYGNGVTGLNWSVPSGTVSDVSSSDSEYSATIGGSSGTLTIRATDKGSALYREVSVTVTKVTLTLNKNSTTVVQGKSETLTATHNASEVGGVNWASNNAKVTVENGVVTVAEDAVVDSTATITATSAVDGTVSATCTVTVAAAPLSYVITGPSTTQANGSGLTVDTLSTYYPIDNKDYIEWTAVTGSAFGSASSAMRFGTSTASNVGSVTLSLKDKAPIYFTSVSVNAKTWSTETGNTLSVNGETAAVTTSYDDYDFDIDSDVTSITIGNGTKRVNVYSIEVFYAYKDPELHASSTSVEALVNTNSTSVSLTYENYTPTGYTFNIIDGSSVTNVSFNTAGTPHTATFTTHASVTGPSTVRITGTGGGKSAYVDVTVTVTNPRNIIGLSITTESDATSFKVGDAFDVGSLVVTATFDAEPTSVIYSKAAGNLASLTFDPAIGYTFTESDIGTATIAIELAVGSGDEITGYDVTVADKDYAALVTDIEDLWDGQKVYFSNGSDMAINKYTSGNNVDSSSATIHPTKGLDIASTSGYAYTVIRVNIDGTIYYAFALYEEEDVYYLKDNGTSGNYLAKTDDRSDDAIYWTISAGANSGQWTITKRSNEHRPYLQINDPLMACYNNTQTDPYLYAVTSYDAGAVAEAFEENRMHMTDYTTEEGWCKDSEHDYYGQAKAVWNAMDTTERGAVSANAKARLAAWAAANGQTYNKDNSAISAANRFAPLGVNTSDNKSVLWLLVALGAGTAALGGFAFMAKRHRKED